MRMSHILAAALPFALFISWLSAEALLRVQVIDEQGNPIHKAEVSVATPKQKRGKTAETDRRGLADFKKLKNGYYRVWARAEGYKPGLFEFLRVSGEEEKSIRIELETGFHGVELYFESPSLLARSKQLASEGLAAMAAQEFANAEDMFKKSLAISPCDPYTHKNLSIVYVNLEKWELAGESLNNASDCLHALGTMGALETMEVDGQEAEIDQLRRRIPERRLAAEADEAMERQDLAGAISKLQELVKLVPGNAEYHYYLANSLARAGRDDEAVKAIDSALELDPDESRYLRFKSSLVELADERAADRGKALVKEIQKLQDADKYEAVLDRCEKAIGTVPDAYQPLLLLQMARAQAGLGQTEEAIAAYRKSADLAPGTAETSRELARYLIELERYEEAFESLREVSETESSPYDQALFQLAKELVQEGKQTQARFTFEKVLEVNPQHAKSYYELGIDYYYSGQDQERARAMLEKYIEIGEDPELLGNAKTLLKVIK